MMLSSLLDHFRVRIRDGRWRRTRVRPIEDLSGHRLLGRVAKVLVETPATGPRPTDLRWLLADAEDRILFVLQGAAAPGKELIDRMGSARGFDKAAIRRAMRSTRHARFVIWQRDRIADQASAAG